MNPVRRHLSSSKITRKDGSKRRLAKKSRIRYCCSENQLRQYRKLKKYFSEKRDKRESKRTKG